MLRSSPLTQFTKRSTINNRRLVLFTFSRAIKADRKRKLKLNTSNAYITVKNATLTFDAVDNFLRSKIVRQESGIHIHIYPRTLG